MSAEFATLLNAKPKGKKKFYDGVSNIRPLKKIAAYIRVSTEEQAVNPEGSIKNQEERIKLQLKHKNQDAPFGELTEVFVDRGLSGKDMNRPALQKMIRLIQAGEIDLIIVTELSRLSRSIRDFSQMWDFLRSYNCELWCLRENFDTSTAAGEMMLYSIANFAQFERKQTAERVAANFESRASRGLYNGGPLPIGFEIDPATPGSLKVNEAEAKIVQTAFHALLREGSLSVAAKWLNENGYRGYVPRRGGGKYERTGFFTLANLKNMLQNKRYIGIRTYRSRDGKPHEVQAGWQPIVDKTTFELVQEIINKNRKRRIPSEKRYLFTLGGKVSCRQCGMAMNGKSAHGNSGKVPYYEHGAQMKKESCLPVHERKEKCRPFRVLARTLEENVWTVVEELLREPEESRIIFEKLEFKMKQKTADQGMDVVKSNIDILDKKTQLLANRLANLPESISPIPIYNELEKLNVEKRELETRLQELKSQHPSATVTPIGYKKFLERLAKIGLANPTRETKRKLVDCLIARIVITPEGFDLAFHVDVDKIKKGEAVASPFKSLEKKSLSAGSFILKNGWSDWG